MKFLEKVLSTKLLLLPAIGLTAALSLTGCQQKEEGLTELTLNEVAHNMRRLSSDILRRKVSR